jgi:pyruvate/2-oxoglutarate/acetoin dehydrogenase E1 component
LGRVRHGKVWFGMVGGGDETPYFRELCSAMSLLAEHPRSIFMGQSVLYEGTAMHRTLKHIDPAKRLELPVFEDCQLGMATGMSLNGDLPICAYPRINFLLCAMSQLCLHLDKIPQYSAYKPKVIIRTAVATDYPLNPGIQHLGLYFRQIAGMLDVVRVVPLYTPEQIMLEYKQALDFDGSTLIVEMLGNY